VSQLEHTSWTAAIQLFADSYTFVSVVRRTHTDWPQDVIPALRRAAADPRGWEGMAWDEYDRTTERPFYPFKPTDAASLDQHLAEITRESAETLLVAMSQDSFRASWLLDFPDQKERLLTKAQTLLSRFGLQCTFYTNSGYSRTASDHDFFESANWIYPYSEHPLDLGLIVVSDEEIGIFWSFDAS
jgi:hypothetical protein